MAINTYPSVPLLQKDLIDDGAGYYPNKIAFDVEGECDTVNNTRVDVTNIGAAGAGAPYVFPPAGGIQMSVISTSANDAAAGSGVQQVEMHYLDSTGASQVETITMNGTTPVNSVATNVRFIQFIHTIRNGSFGANAAGTITAYKVATPATVYNTILAGENISLSSHRMVPLGKTFYMNSVAASATSNKPVSVRLTATCDDDGVLTQGIFLFNELFELQDSSLSIHIPTPRKFPALTIIKGKAISTTAGGSVEISYGGWIE